MRRTLLIVAAVAAVVFALTWLASSWLTGDEPPFAEGAATPRAETRPRAAAHDDALPEPAGAATRPAAPREDIARVGAQAQGPPVEMAESPFATERSAELDYAVQLVFGPDAGPDTWRSAAEVFERCLKQAPNNQRCYQGLVAAQSRLAGQDSGVTAADLTPPLPAEDTTRRIILNPSLTEGVQRPIERR